MNIESLQAILELEREKGYTDRAVIGGLDKYLQRWAGKVKEEINDPALLRRFNELQLSNSDYRHWNLEQRRRWVSQVLDWLTEVNQSKIKKGTLALVSPALVSKPSKFSPKSLSSEDKRGLDLPVTTVKGVSKALAAKFSRLGVKTIRDLLYFFPRRHLDYSQRKSIAELKEGEEQTILGIVWQARVATFGGRQGTEAIIGDDTGNVRAVWFNQPYLAKNLPTNARIVISGKVNIFKGQRVFESPEWELVKNEELIHTGRLVPVYPLTQGLYQRQLRRLIKRVIDERVWEITDFLPKDIKERCQLLDLPEAIIQAHYPDNLQSKDKARERLAFDELFLLQLGVLSKKYNWMEGQPGKALVIDWALINNFLRSLPFTLTSAQKRVLLEILNDLEKSKPMSRLLQGEVGSGKTIVAAIALLIIAANNYQSALMAPTEILAEQHFDNICQFFHQLGSGKKETKNLHCFFGLLSHPLTVALLIGSLSGKEKDELRYRISKGEVDIVIGTHALIQEGVEFKNLVLAVIDEQHRFGVLQRSALRQKGFNPHVLVMTATPIPRTLALTLYGDLDLSVIDELPPGRQRVKTRWLEPEQREQAYAFLKREISKGRQAFIICPLIEESENIEAKAAVAEYKRLSQEVFPEFRLGLLHGRMSAEDKEKTMRLFRDGFLDILVSTPVVEVGIDVPNATVMLVEGADRFGLSQLHQFRGRVGRGKEKSYCLLVAENPSPEGRERLKLIEEIYDGFALAEADLKMRGPGEFFGTRQSGLPDLRLAKLSDLSLLELARKEAAYLFEKDPGLKSPEHTLLVRELARVWKTGAEWS